MSFELSLSLGMSFLYSNPTDLPTNNLAKLIIESTIESTVDSITGANDEDTLDEDLDSNSADNDASNNIIIRDLDVESNAILEEVKLKKRNRLIVNAKFKKLR